MNKIYIITSLSLKKSREEAEHLCPQGWHYNLEDAIKLVEELDSEAGWFSHIVIEELKEGLNLQSFTGKDEVWFEFCEGEEFKKKKVVRPEELKMYNLHGIHGLYGPSIKERKKNGS